MTLTRKPPGQNAAKWNWEPILEAVDSGMPIKEVAARFSIPIGSLRCKVGEVRKAGAAIARKLQLQVRGEEGQPALYQSPMAKEVQKTEIFQPVPAELSLSDLETVFSDPDAILSLDPQAFEKLVGRKAQLMLAQALTVAPEARTLKDVATVHKLFREANGIGDASKGAAGLLSPPRAFGRRPVMQDAVMVVEDAGLPVGGWPAGMLD